MRFLLLIGLLSVYMYSPAQIMTVITTLQNGSRDTIKFGFIQNATIDEDLALGEVNLFMSPAIGYEGRILQRDQSNFSCAMIYDQTPVYYDNNFDSKTNYRNASDTSLQNRLFETWYTDSNIDSIEMFCDIPISSFLQFGYWHVAACDSDPPAPIGLLVIEDDTATHTKWKTTLGIDLKQLIYITDPEIILNTNNHLPITSGLLAIDIFPNPAQETVTIKLPGLQKIKEVSIFNSLGKLLLRQSSNSSDAEIDISAFSNGVYCIVVVSGNGDQAIKKLIKQ